MSSTTNETATELYLRYKHLMRATLEEAQRSPEEFINENYAMAFRQKIDMIDALISLYSSLILMNQN